MENKNTYGHLNSLFYFLGEQLDNIYGELSRVGKIEGDTVDIQLKNINKKMQRINELHFVKSLNVEVDELEEDPFEDIRENPSGYWGFTDGVK